MAERARERTGHAGRLLGPFFRQVVGITRSAFWRAIAVMALGGLTSSLSVVLLIPLVQAIGTGIDAPADATGLFRWVLGVTGTAPSLPLVLSLLVAAVAAQGALRWYEARVQAAVTQDVVLALRQRLYRRLFAVDWIAFSRRRTADLLEALTRQIDRVGYAANDLLGLCAAAVTAVIYTALATAISLPVTAVVLLLGGLLSLAVSRRRHEASRIGDALTSADRLWYRAVDAALASMKLVRSYGREAGQVEGLDAVAAPLRHVHIRLAGNPAVVRAWFDTGVAIILALAVFVGLGALALQPAELFVLLVVFVRLAPHLSTVQAYHHALAAELPAFRAVTDLELELDAATRPPVAPAAATDWLGDVSLDAVGFTYGREPILDSVSLQVPAGRTVAIVGPSGAGKTTVADLVMGLLQPQSGRVQAGGRLLDDALAAACRAHIGYVPQDPFLFHDTIRHNLLWARPDATESEMWEALAAASADFVMRLPEALDTIVGDRGTLLSVGERQRLALARALLRRPRLLVLDEATSALDSENERAIHAAVANLHGATTILVIAHRLSTVRDADRIYVLDAGRIVESGTWRELITSPVGRFRALCTAQGILADSGEPPDDHTRQADRHG
jgi:ATP-binding cassette subfamily C protein